MSALWSYLVLPPEISAFERTYLERINRIALGFFALHVPVYAAIAYANDTGPLTAVVLTALAVVGPWLAGRALPNPRHVSVVYGVTAMYAGALLVHFGRGLWTIEMHFYFFVALALLAVFANPLVILTAAVTVAVHHAVGWLVAPTSVFNYDAPLSSVVVHATFVVLESTAACFVARSFFDNVIGLEKIVAERTRALDQKTRDIQLVLDNAAQGFLTASIGGDLFPEHSRAVREWLGAPRAGTPVWEFFAPAGESFCTWLRLGWESLGDDVLPIELLLEQLPHRFTIDERTFQVEYRLVLADAAPRQVLVVVTDASERVARERADAVQRETMAVFERIGRDRSGFVEFFDDTARLVADVTAAPCALDATELARAIHTVKGNCAVFGVTSVADACHHAEALAAEVGGVFEPAALAAIGRAWAAAGERVIAMLGDRNHGVIEIDEAEFVLVLRAIHENLPRAQVAAMIEGWRHEPARRRLQRVGEQAQRVAERIGAGPIAVSIADDGVRLPREPLAAFWQSLVHVVRNAVDHGLNGVPGPAIELSTRVVDGRVVVGVRDNGHGIDWDRVREKAAARGLASERRGDLVAALFSDRFSTRDEATEVSGRGVGLAAVRAACDAAGIEVRLSSEAGFGTRFEFVLPVACTPSAVAAA